MLLYSFPAYADLAKQLQSLPSVQAGRFTVARFSNEELNVRVQGRVTGEHCLILGTIAPPDEQMLTFLLLAHTLKKEGAKKVTALLPYLAYSRQDKDKPEESLATAWCGVLLKSSGIDQVLTIDVHSERDKELFPIPLISISTADLFAKAIKEHQLTDVTVVAPDNGAIGRCEAVKKAAGMPVGETPYFEKKRTESGIVHRGPIGKVGHRVLLVDDMLDTGGTLISACEKLREAGVEEIYVLVTHGLFTGAFWTKLWALGVRRIFCTDTVPLRSDFEAANIRVLRVAALLKEKLAELDREGQPMSGRGA